MNDKEKSQSKGTSGPKLPKELQRIAELVDECIRSGSEDGLAQALRSAEVLHPRLEEPADQGVLHYFEANAWSGMRGLHQSSKEAAWDWQQAELKKEILCLRRAAAIADSHRMQEEYVCRILTNLGNALDTVGRFVEALPHWSEALRKVPAFSMARGNRAIGLTTYAGLLHDRGHVAILLKRAHQELAALGSDVEPHAAPNFDSLRQQIESWLSPDYLATDFTFDKPSLGKTQGERQYRQWCLWEGLFLNPLNDVDTWHVAAHDCLSLPPIVTHIDQGPHYFGFFNQMKQEFVSARYLLYSGLNSRTPHFSDRAVPLYNTLDYPTYGIAIEKVRLAFRAAYSLFDKMAYFLNDYFCLGIPEKNVKLSTLWYEGDTKQKPKPLRSIFRTLANLPLRGLFWASKDLFEDEPGFRDAIEPAARELKEIRNHLEHKYLKVHEMLPTPMLGLTDTLAHSVGRAEFEEMALHLVRLVRACLIYLSLAVGVEERRRARERGPEDVVPPSFLDAIEDDWKM